MTRHKKIKNESNIKPGELYYTIKQLWESGIIGIEVVPSPEITSLHLRELRNMLPSEGYIKYNLKGGKNIDRWYYFEYNWNKSPHILIKRFENADDGKARFILHPSTFEMLLPTIHSDCPIGV